MATGKVDIKLRYLSTSGWRKDSSWKVSLDSLEKVAGRVVLQKRSHRKRAVLEEERAAKVPITLPRLKFLERNET